MTFKLKLVKQPSFELSFSNLVVRGVDPSDATATEEDVFADATFYAKDNAIKTGVLDPYIEYMKYQDLAYELSNGRPIPTDEEYLNEIKPRVLNLLNYILGGERSVQSGN